MEIKLSYEGFTKSSQFNQVEDQLAITTLFPRQAFAMAVQALNQALGGMEPNFKYKAEHLFEIDVWLTMSDRVRRSVGLCLSYLVANDLVPLVYANKPWVKNRVYRLKQDVDPTLYFFKVC